MNLSNYDKFLIDTIRNISEQEKLQYLKTLNISEKEINKLCNKINNEANNT